MIQEHAQLVRALLDVRWDLDSKLRENSSAHVAARERAHKRAAVAMDRLADTHTRLAALLARAAASDLPTDTSGPLPTDLGGEPAALFVQSVERLEQAISHAEHTQAALAAERERHKQLLHERERGRRERLADEQRRLDRAREDDWKLAAGGVAALVASALAGALLTSSAGLLVPALGAIALSIAMAQVANTLVQRVGRPWSSSPSLAYARGEPRWVLSAAAALLFGVYGLASLGGGIALVRLGSSAAIASLGAAATIWRRTQLNRSDKQD